MKKFALLIATAVAALSLTACAFDHDRYDGPGHNHRDRNSHHDGDHNDHSGY